MKIRADTKKRKRRSKIADSSDEEDEGNKLSHDMEQNTISSQPQAREEKTMMKKVKVEEPAIEKDIPDDAASNEDEDEEIEQAKREEEEADRELKEDKAVAKQL